MALPEGVKPQYAIFTADKEFADYEIDTYARSHNCQIAKKVKSSNDSFAIMDIVTPSTKTIYAMITVNELTQNNIKTIGETGKDIVDYITDQIDKVVNEDEDKENK